MAIGLDKVKLFLDEMAHSRSFARFSFEDIQNRLIEYRKEVIKLDNDIQNKKLFGRFGY